MIKKRLSILAVIVALVLTFGYQQSLFSQIVSGLETEGDSPQVVSIGDMDCSGIVRVWLDNKGKPIQYRLVCQGDCPREQKCEKRSSKSLHGGVQEWCSCSESNLSECHIVLRTIGEGEGIQRAGQKEILCGGGCNGDDAICQLVIVAERNIILKEPTGDFLPQGKPIKRGKVIDVRCKCL